MAKNPFLSAYLSAANTMYNTARGQAQAAGRSAVKRNQKSAMDAWRSMWLPTSKPTKRAPTKKRP